MLAVKFHSSVAAVLPGSLPPIAKEEVFDELALGELNCLLAVARSPTSYQDVPSNCSVIATIGVDLPPKPIAAV